MIAIIDNKLNVVRDVCRRLNIRRLGVLHDGMQVPLAMPDGTWSRPEDLLHVGVNFGTPPAGMDEADQFFAAIEEVSDAFDRPVLMANLDVRRSPLASKIDEDNLEVLYDVNADGNAAVA